MKKIKFIVLALILSFSLIACGGDKKADPKAEQPNSPKAEATKQESSADKAFVFEFKEVKIPMNAKADDILKALGEPKEFFESPTCAFEGKDRIYTYPSFQLSTYEKDKAEYVLGILLFDDTVKTKEGLRLFDPIAKVEELYGKTKANEGLYKYEKGDSEFSVVDENGKVSSIEYRAILKIAK